MIFAPMQKLQPHRWLAAFFAFGATMCGLTTGLLLLPGTSLDSLWRLNPDAHLAFQSIGDWSIVLMVAVGTACFLAAIGLWHGSLWGTRLALIILSVNIVGDLINALFRRDYRALIGLLIGAAMIFYLLRSKADPQRIAPGQRRIFHKAMNISVEFRHVVGLYGVTFFIVWQLINFISFRTLPNLSIFVGGALIVIGGVLVTFWKPGHSP
jgi:uncharacterized membrane protein (DUF2068 family)